MNRVFILRRYLSKFSDSTVDGAKRTAQLLRNTNTLIITVSVDSDGDFSSLATGPNYVFEIRNVTDDIPVVQQIGNILGVRRPREHTRQTKINCRGRGQS